MEAHPGGSSPAGSGLTCMQLSFTRCSHFGGPRRCNWEASHQLAPWWLPTLHDVAEAEGVCQGRCEAGEWVADPGCCQALFGASGFIPMAQLEFRCTPFSNVWQGRLMLSRLFLPMLEKEGWVRCLLTAYNQSFSVCMMTAHLFGGRQHSGRCDFTLAGSKTYTFCIVRNR